MGFDLMSGLMAGANFMQGMQQGQERATLEKMQQLELQSAQLNQQQRDLQARQDQARSDYMMQNFQPTVIDPVTGKVVSGPTPQQRLNSLSNFDAQQGNITGLGQDMTQSANLANSQQEQQMNAMRIHQMHAAFGAQVASSLPDTPQGLQMWKAQMLQGGNLPPQAVDNITAMTWTPGMLGPTGSIAKRGTSMSDQLKQQYDQQRFTQQEKLQKQRQQAAIDLEQQRQRDRIAAQDYAARTKKSQGATPRVSSPTPTEIASAENVINQAFPQGIDSPVDVERIKNDVAQQAKVYQAQNPGMTFNAAVQHIVQVKKQTGELSTTVVGKGLFSSGEIKVTRTGLGEDPSKPIKVSPHFNPSDLEAGKWYQNAKGQVARYLGNGKWATQ